MNGPLEHGILLFLTIGVLIEFHDVATEQSIPGGFGKYFLHITELSICNRNQPKKDSFISSLQITNNTIKEQIVLGNFSVLKSHGPVEGKFRAFIWNKGKFNRAISLNIPNICYEMFMQSILNKFIKFDRNCFIQQGNYSIKVNVNAISHEVFGDSLFFGKYKMLISFMAGKNVIVCANSIMSVLQKN